MTEQEVRDSIERMINLRKRDLKMFQETDLDFSNPDLLKVQRTHIIIEKERLSIEEMLSENNIYVDTTDPHKTFVWKSYEENIHIWMIRDSLGNWARAEIVTE